MCDRCFTKYAWVKPLKDRKAKTVLHCFIETVNKSKGKPSKLQVDQGRDSIITLCKND